MFAIANVIFSQNLPSVYHSAAPLHPTARLTTTTTALLHPTATLTTTAPLHPTATSTTAALPHPTAASTTATLLHPTATLTTTTTTLLHPTATSTTAALFHFTATSTTTAPLHPTATLTTARHFAQQSRLNSSAENFSYFFKKALDKYPKTVYNVYCYLGVAQIGSALPWGGRGRRFKSCHSDHKSTVILIELRWTFSMPENRLIQGFSAVLAHK